MKGKSFSVLLASDEEKAARKRGDQKRRAMKREKDLAKKTGGRRQPGSGAGPNQKGDVKAPGVLYDDKFTDKMSFTVTQRDLAKLCEEAQGHGNRVPAMHIGFETPIEEMRWRPRDWVLVPFDAWEEAVGGRR